MKHGFLCILLVFTALLSACESEKLSPNVVELSVQFTWEGLKPCGWGNQEIHIIRYSYDH